jgi:hypothetical protein
MSQANRSRTSRGLAAISLIAGATALLAQCRSSGKSARSSTGGAAAWETVYEVLQHPRCLNCHPAGDSPLQGDERAAHAQNVRRGPEGHGMFAMRCETCHQTQNAIGPHLPPGAPNWHLPEPGMKLVFEGRSSGELCRQMKDPKQNGHKTPEQLYHHFADDALVGWGWDPGVGRAPVPIPREELVAAVRAWIDGGCGCPE